MADSKPYHRVSVHQSLGGGLVADVLLWKKWRGGAVLLVSATALWFLFERAEYNFLSFVANVLLLLVIILFFWAKAASLLHRPLPPLPDLEISDDSVNIASDLLQMWINCALSIAHEIAIGRNLILFLQIAAGLWFLSYIGSLFNLLTLMYMVVLLSLSLPLLYDKYQDQIDGKLHPIYRIVRTQCGKFDSNILRRISVPSSKEKKMQ